jgi:hypothetical protein
MTVDSTKVELFVSVCVLTAAAELTNMLSATFWVVQGMQHQLRRRKCGACCFLDCPISILSTVNPRSLSDTNSFLENGSDSEKSDSGNVFPIILNGKSSNAFPSPFKTSQQSSLRTIFSLLHRAFLSQFSKKNQQMH